MKHFGVIYATVAVAGTAAVFFAAPKFAKYRAPRTTPSHLRADALRDDGAPDPESLKPPAREQPPSFYQIALARRMTNATWGVTRQETSLYSLSGRNLGKLPAGVAFRKWDVRESSRGRMLAVAPYVPGQRYSTTTLIASAAALLLTGNPDDLPPPQYAALTNYYALSGKIAARRAELQQAVSSECPHYEEATELYKRYQAFLEAGRAIARKRDRAAGPEKTRLETLLNERKTPEAKLARSVKDANEKFKAWKEQNKARFDAVEGDERIGDWREEQGKLREHIPGLAI